VISGVDGEQARNPAVGRAVAHIQGMIPVLNASEARVAEVLFARAEELEQWSVTEVAREAGTGMATVVRACQSLGYSGFNQLRETLRQAGRDDSRVSALPSEPLAALDRTLEAGLEQIHSMAAMLDREEFVRAVDALATAPRVLLATVSDLAMLGQYAVHHFTMIGRSAEAPTDVMTLHAVATQLKPGDVCIAVGHKGHNALTIRIVQAAKAAGATVLAITSFARGTLAEIADLHLAVGVTVPELGTHAVTRVRVGQMLAIDALQRALTTRLDTSGPTEAMLNTMTQYGYQAPRPEHEPRL
jgi:RpiR family carbohydrate utilization transcriptional regulator